MYMGKIVKPSEKIIQKQIGFHKRQIEFFKKYPDFNPDKLCREMVDEQIKLINTDFMEKFNNEGII